MSMNVKDGVAEALLIKRVGKAARSDIRVVINTKKNFVPETESCVNGLECVFVKVCEGIRGGGVRNTGCSKVSEVLGPNGATPVW